ncbi:MAG: MarR family transcriptional regulator [Verrucomicrobiaceae bacterium]|nr:MAG: MarR family transcriptional regulator [Verrucomicrobiaceae bacterium]
MVTPFEIRRPVDLGNMEQMAAPKHRVLAELIQGCSEDPNSRTAIVTSLAVSLWQVAGRGMSGHPPSLILLNGSGSFPDPLNDFTGHLVKDRDAELPRIHYSGGFAFSRPETAPHGMAQAIQEIRRLGAPNDQNIQRYRAVEDRYFSAQVTGFGSGRTRSYSAAWHETFDLLTDRNNELLVRLDSEADFSLFCHHLLKDLKKIVCPLGYGAGLVTVSKSTTISGSFCLETWDPAVASKMVETGLPFVFLPHVVTVPPIVGNRPALDFITDLLPGAFQAPVIEPANLLPEEWSERLGAHLRERLRELPATYEYSMQRIARQLFPVCRRLALWAGQESGATATEMESLLLDLYSHSLRGLVIGVAGLAWHGQGVAWGIPRPQALRALRHLRDKGPMTKVELMRCAHLSRTDRNTLLERLLTEGLVSFKDRDIVASSYEEFVTGLYSRKDFALAE